MRWFLTILAWVVSSAVLAPFCYFGAILMAGPHSSALPERLQFPVLLIAWAVLIVVPVLVARRVWRR